MPSGTSIWPGPAGGTRRIVGAQECRVVVSHVGSCWNQELGEQAGLVKQAEWVEVAGPTEFVAVVVAGLTESN